MLSFYLPLNWLFVVKIDFITHMINHPSSTSTPHEAHTIVFVYLPSFNLASYILRLTRVLPYTNAITNIGNSSGYGAALMQFLLACCSHNGLHPAAI